MNNLLDYYFENNISPVKQNIDDFEKHFYRRLLLYKEVGLPSVAFKGSRILEIGPGGGYNSIVTAMFKVGGYDLVEPNPTGFEELKNNFEQFNGEFKDVKFFNCSVEQFKKEHPANKYDIVICEGLIATTSSKDAIIDGIKNSVDSGGVAVVTCEDPISFFFEEIRVIIADKLTKNIQDYSQKVDLVLSAFGSHIETLKGMSRLPKDWVMDTLLNPVLTDMQYEFSIKDALEFFSDDFYYLGSSPNMFRNFLWYKEIPQSQKEYNSLVSEQFLANWHNLIHYKIVSQERDIALNLELFELCKKFVFQIVEHKYEDDNEIIFIDTLKMIAQNLTGLDSQITDAISEAIQIFENRDYLASSIANNYPALRRSFGRGMQYISFVRRVD